MDAHDLAIFVGVALSLLFVVMMASYVPARKAIRHRGGCEAIIALPVIYDSFLT